MITVQPIRYTAHPDQWHTLAEALGLVAAFPPAPEWSEFDTDGIFALHHADTHLAGRTDLHVLVDDLESIEARLVEAGVPLERSHLDDVGPLLTLVTGNGGAVSVSGGARATDPAPLRVMPLWYTEDLGPARQALEAIGLRPRIASTAGGWVDFQADGGGLAALHHGPTPRVELSFEYAGDLDAYAQHLVDAGLQPAIIDEAHGRTIRLTTPDGDELWINGTQDDLYGYTRLDSGLVT